MEKENTMLERPPVATDQLQPAWLGTRYMQHTAMHLDSEKQEREQREW